MIRLWLDRLLYRLFGRRRRVWWPDNGSWDSSCPPEDEE
jgi:hypothetical protein